MSSSASATHVPAEENTLNMAAELVVELQTNLQRYQAELAALAAAAPLAPVRISPCSISNALPRLIVCLHSEFCISIPQDTDAVRQNLHDAIRATGSALLDLRRATIHAPRDANSSAAPMRPASHYCYVDFTEDDALPDNRSGASTLPRMSPCAPMLPSNSSHSDSHTMDTVLCEIPGEEAWGDSAVHPIYVDDSDSDSGSSSDDDARVHAGRECIVIDDDDDDNPNGSESDGLDDSDDVVFIKSTTAPPRQIPNAARAATSESSRTHRSRLFSSQSLSSSASSDTIFGGLLSSAATSSSTGSHFGAHCPPPSSMRTVAPEFASWESSSSGFGSRYLAKFGFTAGAGLGARGQGVAEPVGIDQPVLAKQLGLDFVRQARERAAAKLVSKREGEGRRGASSSSMTMAPLHHSKSKHHAAGGGSVPNWRSEETLAQRVFRMDHQRGVAGAGSLPSAAQRTAVVSTPTVSTLGNSISAKRAF